MKIETSTQILRLRKFVTESNKIESVFDEKEIELSYKKTKELLFQPYVDIADLSRFNTSGLLRDRFGMNVRVGGHFPLPGGMGIIKGLNTILRKVNERTDPYDIHQEFETLHPYTDGNGRTGRVLWLWQMLHQHNYDMSLEFLHLYYYQSLDNNRQ